MYEAEQKHKKQENEAFGRLLRAQQDAEEQRQQHPQSPHWIHPTPVGSTTASAWPMHHSPAPQQSISPKAQGMMPATTLMSQQLMQPPINIEGEVTPKPTNGSHGNPPVSSIQDNTNQHFYNL